MKGRMMHAIRPHAAAAVNYTNLYSPRHGSSTEKPHNLYISIRINCSFKIKKLQKTKEQETHNVSKNTT